MEKYKIIKKAYKINFNVIDEGYLSSIVWCYSENRNKAKKELLYKVRYDDWKLKFSDEIINYLNIPVIRYEDYDLISFEGNNIKRCDINLLLKERERNNNLDDILNNDDIKYCYILKGGYYYLPNYSGYTEFRNEAGIYDKKDAIESAKSCKELFIKPINIIEHNKLINDKIEKLQKQLIS